MVFGANNVIICEFIYKQLLFLMDSVYALPIIIGFAVFFYFFDPCKISFVDIKKLTVVNLFLAFCGIFTAFSEPAMLYFNLYDQGLNPRIPGIFEKGILPYTTSAICLCTGIIPLLIFKFKLSSLPQYHENKKIPKNLYALLSISVIFLFISICLRHFPFAEYPEGMGTGYMLLLILQQSLHKFIGSFAPAGICALAFRMFTFRNSKEDSNTILQNLSSHTRIYRFCYIACIVGLAPQCLMAIGRIIEFFLHKNIICQPIAYLWQNFFLVGTLSCFGVLLFSRFSMSRIWQYLAILVYFISWNWPIIVALSESWLTL